MTRTRTLTQDRFAPGVRIGDYRVEREVRSEHTGMVYAAVHLVLPRRAAIKVMHPNQAWMRSLAVQILREACILEALHHPGAPRVYECGVLPDKRPWVALELVEGQTIAETTLEQPLGVSELVVMIRGIADILEHAHARGVVHHRLSDQVIVRTPDRASPVCLRGWGDVVTHDSTLAADPSSDVHALGSVAYRALTGSPLAESASAQRQCPAAPAELTHLIDQMLAADPRDRPTAAAVRERAAWLAETLELVPLQKPRSTPGLGVSAASPSVEAPRHRSPTSEFVIRINRS